MSPSGPTLAERPGAIEHIVEAVSARSPRQKWALRLFPDGLRLEPLEAGEPAIHVVRYEALDRLDAVDFGLARRILVVRKPQKRTFELDAAAWADAMRWLGRDARLRIALKRRLGLGVPIGIVVLLAALPLPGDPAAGIEGVPFNPFNLVLGVVIVATAILARRRPHRALFLVDSAWFAALAVSLVWQVAHGGSALWLLVVALQVLLVWSGLGLFREFGDARRS